MKKDIELTNQTDTKGIQVQIAGHIDKKHCQVQVAASSKIDTKDPKMYSILDFQFCNETPSIMIILNP